VACPGQAIAWIRARWTGLGEWGAGAADRGATSLEDPEHPVDALTVLSFLPVLLYLAVVSVLLLAAGRCPEWAHPLAVLAGLPVAIAANEWLDALAGAGIGAGVFVLTVLFGSRLLTGTSAFTVCTTLALLPPGVGVLAVLTGLIVAVLVGVTQTIHASGVGRVRDLLYGMVNALGALGGSVGKPDLDMLAGTSEVVRSSRGPVLYLAPCLFIGAVITGWLQAR
jgi:hypothetical protein